jgi:chemotaxis protein MotA
VNSTYIGYIFFVLAAYILLVFGADEHAVKAFQSLYFSDTVGRYIHLPGFLFVSLGVLSSILISHNFREFIRSHHALYQVFFRNKIDYAYHIGVLRTVSEYTQTKDIETLEEYANGISNPFLKDGLVMLVNGYKVEDIKEILELRLQTEMMREEIDDDLWRSAASYSPGYGMLGTTVGLIQMFSQKIDAATGFNGIINSMSIAFTTTLYGLLYSNFIFQPIAEKINKINTENIILKGMIIDGIVMIHGKKRTQFLEEKLMNYIPTNRSMTSMKMKILNEIQKTM